MGIAFFLLGMVIGLVKLPAMPHAERHGQSGPKTSLWKYRHLVLGTVAIFVYVGGEVSIGSFLINYFTQKSIGNITEVAAAGVGGYYWGGGVVGRVIGSAILQKVKA